MLPFSEKLLKSIPIPILVLNPDESIAWQNSAFTTSFDVHLENRSVDLSIKSPNRLIDVFRDPEVLAIFRFRLNLLNESDVKDLAVPTGTFSYEIKGKNRHFNIETQFIEGKAVFLFHDQTDIQKRKRELEDFLANLSHELRTPITSLLGYTNLIESGMPEPTLQRYKTVILRNIERIRYFEQSIHAWVENRRREIKLERFDLKDLILNLVSDFEPYAKSIGSNINVLDHENGLNNYVIKSDRGLAVEIFQNLIDNALKYSKPHTDVIIQLSHVNEFGPTSSATITSKSKKWGKGPILKIDIMDEGPGIPSHLQSRIFERFFRMDFIPKSQNGHSNESIPTHKGTGLGLNIVKENIKRLGGQIHVMERKMPTGTVFSVYLPSAE